MTKDRDNHLFTCRDCGEMYDFLDPEKPLSTLLRCHDCIGRRAEQEYQDRQAEEAYTETRWTV